MSSPATLRASLHYLYERAAMAVATLSLSVAAAAAEPRIDVELHALQPVDGGCRTTLVLTNGLDIEISRLTLETVVFDGDGSVVRFLLLNSRPLPAGTIRVQQFDIDGLGCDGISRLLINDVPVCDGDGLDPARCMAALTPSSRTSVGFDDGSISPDRS